MAKTKHTLIRNLPIAASVVAAVLAPVSIAWAEYANPRGVAVIIGNSDYEHRDVPDVSFAHRDAEAFRRYVVDVLGYDPANVVDLRDATRRELLDAFGTRADPKSLLWSYLDPDAGSDVVVYYSGHGVPGVNDGLGYLLPVDADPGAAEDDGYPVDLLYRNVGGLAEAHSVRVYLDACFSGGSHAGSLIGSASPVYVEASLPEGVGEKVTSLTAASGKQLASWDEGARHGLFTTHLLDALYGGGDADGDGRVTASEAKGYLDRHMTRAARRQHRRVQHASLIGAQGAVLAAAADGAFPPRPGRVFRDCAECPEVVVVPAGSFRMGSPDSEVGRDNREGPARRVEIRHPFAVGKHEVTRGEFRRFVKETGYATVDTCWIVGSSHSSSPKKGHHWRQPGFGQTEIHPVVCVDWNDAQAYARWMSRKTGARYRLPSEAEWEYAARGGTSTPRFWGVGPAEACSYANGSDHTIQEAYSKRKWRRVHPCRDGHAHTAPVGSFQPNAFGLYDMLGNVGEWVEDCWINGYEDAPRDGRARTGGECTYRAGRGGAWGGTPHALRSAARRMVSRPDERRNNLGFRVARTLIP